MTLSRGARYWNILNMLRNYKEVRRTPKLSLIFSISPFLILSFSPSLLPKYPAIFKLKCQDSCRKSARISGDSRSFSGGIRRVPHEKTAYSDGEYTAVRPV